MSAKSSSNIFIIDLVIKKPIIFDIKFTNHDSDVPENSIVNLVVLPSGITVSFDT